MPDATMTITHATNQSLNTPLLGSLDPRSFETPKPSDLFKMNELTQMHQATNCAQKILACEVIKPEHVVHTNSEILSALK